MRLDSTAKPEPVQGGPRAHVTRARRRNSRIDPVSVAAAINIKGHSCSARRCTGIAFKNRPLTITMKCRTGLASVSVLQPVGHVLDGAGEARQEHHGHHEENVPRIACCCVSATDETKSPTPSIASKYTVMLA